MKIRNGLVSNSSSSSFIVSVSEIPKLTAGGVEIPLNTLIPFEVWFDPTVEGGVESFIKKVNDHYCCHRGTIQEIESEVRNEISWYDKARFAVDSGRSVLHISVDNYDETAQNLIHGMIKAKVFDGICYE